jgi:hypothetical protein
LPATLMQSARRFDTREFTKCWYRCCWWYSRSDTPDSIFPNNWISFHENADVALYPMFAENRRLETEENSWFARRKKVFK